MNTSILTHHPWQLPVDWLPTQSPLWLSRPLEPALWPRKQAELRRATHSLGCLFLRGPFLPLVGRRKVRDKHSRELLGCMEEERLWELNEISGQRSSVTEHAPYENNDAKLEGNCLTWQNGQRRCLVLRSVLTRW